MPNYTPERRAIHAPCPHQPLGQLLLARGILSEDQLHIALLEQTKAPQPIGRLLVSLGFVSEATLRDALSERLGARSIDLSSVVIDPGALALVPREFAKRHRLLPIDYDAHTHRLQVAVADVNDIVAMDRLGALLEERGKIAIDLLLAGEADIERAIDRAYGHELSIDGILHEIETGEVDFCGLQSTADAYSQPVVRLIDSILTDAVKRDSSDIHFEPEAGFLRIRYRIDGRLRQIRSLHQSYWPAMAVRIKVMSGMNIAETRAPQDGRIALNLRGGKISFRVSAQPTLHGENIVLRILDRQHGVLPLAALGFCDRQIGLLQRMIARPEGLILVTGPTGSGKTTTLYSVLHHIDSESLNIMTLEDPVEYPMIRIRQTSLAETAKLDFANGIRSMMRQDPDVILVGEIRDAETAAMAMRAAMTGHQVFATLHTNSSIGAIPRLLDIGVLPELMAGNIIGIVAQRLVRRLCAHCKTADPAKAHEAKLLGVSSATPHPTIFRACGCARCDFQGYRGRLAIVEMLRLNADIDELISRRATAREIRHQAERDGFVSLADDGVRRVLDGSTSLDELRRVVDLSDRC